MLIRAVVASQEPLHILRALAGTEIDAVECCHSGDAAARAAAYLTPELLIISSSPPGESALSALEALPAPPRVVLLSDHKGAIADAAGDIADLAALAKSALSPPMGALSLARLPKREKITEELLDHLRVPASLKGRECLRLAVLYASAWPGANLPLQTLLYPWVSQSARMSIAAVEKSIRAAVESVWLRGDLTRTEELFGLTCSAEKGKPTNAETICMLAEHVKRRMRI